MGKIHKRYGHRQTLSPGERIRIKAEKAERKQKEDELLHLATRNRVREYYSITAGRWKTVTPDPRFEDRVGFGLTILQSSKDAL
jgi:hypothetical protein